MKSRVLWGLVILAIIAVVFYAGYRILSSDESSKTKPKEGNNQQISSEIYFGKWNASIAFLKEKEENSLNLIFIEQNNGNDFSKLDSLVGVQFDDTEIVEVVEYDIFKGDKTGNNQRLMNLIVDIKPKTNQGIDKFSTVSLLYKDREPEVYNIGDIHVYVSQEPINDAIIVEDGYTVSYPKNVFFGSFKNNTQREFRFVNLTSLNDGITYKNIKINGVPLDSGDGMVIHPDEVFSIEANLEVNNNTDYQFLQVTPVMHYIQDSKSCEQTLMGTTYGILNIDDKKVKEIINSDK